MSDTEEPPVKLSKTYIHNEEETSVMDSTDSNLTDELSETVAEVPEMPEITETSAETKMQEDIVTTLQESLEMGEGISMESTEMLEERLQDSLESQEAPEGQEEWLSEDVLTDDDFNPAVESAPDSQTSQPENTENTENPETQFEDPPTPDNIKPEQKHANIDPVHEEIEAKAPEQNIEDALNTLEGGPEKEDDLPDLDAFLIKKTDVKTEAAVPQTKSEKQEADDGNDTDDLLRMLGEDNSKAKKLTKTVKDVRSAVKEMASSDDDDDDFVFEGASAKKLKLAKSLAKKVPPKAEPEDIDGTTDMSSDEADTVKKMFATIKSKQKTKKTESKTEKYQDSSAKNIVSVVERPKKDKLATSTPLRPPRVRSLLLAPQTQPPSSRNGGRNTPDLGAVQVKREPHHHTYSRHKSQNAAKSQTPVKATSILKSAVKTEPKIEPSEVNHEEEFLDDEFNMDEEMETALEDDMSKSRQRIMKPEQMDEDAMSDGESHSEDGSLYDELPSSESEDAEDWFQLDIRAEKAGDYLPLLGPKAKELLLEEKKRVVARVANLKQSLSALTDSGKKQAEQVRTATMALAELDDMLKAS